MEILPHLPFSSFARTYRVCKPFDKPLKYSSGIITSRLSPTRFSVTLASKFESTQYWYATALGLSAA